MKMDSWNDASRIRVVQLYHEKMPIAAVLRDLTETFYGFYIFVLIFFVFKFSTILIMVHLLGGVPFVSLLNAPCTTAMGFSSS